LKLLLIEDDADLVARLRPLLRRAGYAVEWADNGLDGAFLAAEEDYDGLILDLGLPQKSGLELLARLEAVLRRHHGHSGNRLRHRGVVLDLDRQRAIDVEGREIQLTAIEFRLLRYLMLHPGRLFSKTALSEHIYEEEVYINRLRKYFGKDFIRTRRGQGYCLERADD